MPAFQVQYAVEYVVVFVFGLFIGSFLNVLIYRLPIGKSPFWPTWSFCPGCRQPVAWYDNIPVASYIALGAKCRKCRTHISARYTIVELLTAAVFLLVFGCYYGQPGFTWFIYVICASFAAGLIVAVFTDIEHGIIPDEISVWGTGAALIASLLAPGMHESFLAHAAPRSLATLEGLFGSVSRNLDGLASSLVGMAVGAGLTLLVAFAGKALFKRDAMGYGDVKLMALVGALLGAKKAVFTFFAAPFLGLPVGLALLIGKRKHEIPYGPYLAVSAFVAMLWFNPVMSKLLALREMLMDRLMGPL